MLAIAALSGQEEKRADFVADYLAQNGLAVQRVGNNLLARVSANRGMTTARNTKGNTETAGDTARKTVMLCSHLDTVPPSEGYTFDPFAPPPHPTRINGLGSNDAGASVACMIAAALHFAHATTGNTRVASTTADGTTAAAKMASEVKKQHDPTLSFDLLLLLAAGEESSDPEGIAKALPHAGHIDLAIVGEPTGMRAAIAERGLLVLDGVAHGTSGHAARGEGDNAIYRALKDIETLKNHRFECTSATMGAVRLSVTQIEAGNRHNVVPDRCRFVVDVRPTDAYTNAELLNELQLTTESLLTPRSLTNRSSASPEWVARLAQEMGVATFVSPTTSDWMRLGDIPALKMGPGDSARSHTPDEYILKSELAEGLRGYIDFLEGLRM